MEKSEKLTIGQWFGNQWYHYKWLIIFGGLILAFLIGGLVQLISRKEPDVSFLYVGKATITVQGTNRLEATVESLIEDYNKDGEKTVYYLELTALTGDISGTVVDFDSNNAVFRRFENEVRAGDSVIYLLDEYYYNHVLNIGVLAKLSDVLYEKDIPASAIDEYGVYLKDLDIYKTPGFDQLPGNTVLCIRRSPEQDQITYGRKVDVYTANRLCFVELITYTHNQ